MLLGIYGDAHLTKNMRSLQDMWEVTASKSIHHMYNKFDELQVEMVVCLGDFFDTPKLEAKHINFILPILEDINNRTYPTYILLGNHESYDEYSNILSILNMYENIHPITSPMTMEDMCFIPYYESPENIDMKDKTVFTHHDIYGSSLASGKTKAFFGISPDIFKEAKMVFNGHVHLRSRVSENILNTGSILISQQGELVLGNYPQYYTFDTKSMDLNSYDNKHSMIYLTIEDKDAGKIIQNYDQMHCVLRVEYKDEIPEDFINAAHLSWRKKIDSIEDKKEDIIYKSNFDMKNYLSDYIKKDTEVSDDRKEDYVATGLEILG